LILILTIFQIIWDLLNVNTEALASLHYLCDTNNPFEKQVIYIITIIVDNYDPKTKPINFVESELWTKLSGKLKVDAIQPLITRITDGSIYVLNSEPTAADCSFYQ
jgi:hypothetical protein